MHSIPHSVKMQHELCNIIVISKLVDMTYFCKQQFTTIMLYPTKSRGNIKRKCTTILCTCCIPRLLHWHVNLLYLSRFGSFQRRCIASLRSAIEGNSSRDSSRMWQISCIFSLPCCIRRKRCANIWWQKSVCSLALTTSILTWSCPGKRYAARAKPCL